MTETLNRINAQVGGLQKQLAKVDEQVRYSQQIQQQTVGKPAEKAPDAGGKAQPTADSATFITTVDIVNEDDKKRKPPEVRSQRDAKSVEDLYLPDISAPAELPGNVQVPGILKRLLELWRPADKDHQKIWEKGLASRHTQEIIQDLFW